MGWRGIWGRLLGEWLESDGSLGFGCGCNDAEHGVTND